MLFLPSVDQVPGDSIELLSRRRQLTMNHMTEQAQAFVGTAMWSAKSAVPALGSNAADLQEEAQAAATILEQNRKLAGGEWLDRLCHIFYAATIDGPESVKELINAVNRELASRKCPLQVSGSYTEHPFPIGEFVLTNSLTAASCKMRVGPGVTRELYLIALSVLLFS
jgi:hypothetical protein